MDGAEAAMRVSWHGSDMPCQLRGRNEAWCPLLLRVPLDLRVDIDVDVRANAAWIGIDRAR